MSIILSKSESLTERLSPNELEPNFRVFIENLFLQSNSVCFNSYVSLRKRLGKLGGSHYPADRFVLEEVRVTPTEIPAIIREATLSLVGQTPVLPGLGRKSDFYGCANLDIGKVIYKD